MTLSAGTRLGPYEIVAPLGAGGMGEVYRAKDPRLGRDVAIKVLPASFSADADRLRRFEQEAKAAGVLNHPNITAVYDVGSHDGAPYVVQELLEGETLRSVLAGGRLSSRRAIDYSLQVVHGLAAAHEKGIVHRDLKPDNIFVTNDGRVKILDFGLAKLTHAEEKGPVTSLPTASAGTEPGVVMGTIGYMSPEQVRGRPADARSDIFSFGAILYEMLSGNRAFQGDSVADTMSAILKEDPPEISATNQNVPPGLERIVRHCLEKSPEQRFHSAHDVAFDLEALSGLSGVAAAAPAPRRRGSPGLAAAAAAAAALVLFAFWAGRKTGADSAEQRRAFPDFARLTYRRGNVLHARFAPDGQTIVYGAAWGDRPAEIFLSRYGSPESRPLGITNASLLSISPSGELAILLKGRDLYGTVGSGTLARVPLTGGAPREILEDVAAADWAPDGQNLAVLLSRRGRNILEFPIGNRLYETAFSLWWPRVSPDGRSVALIEYGATGASIRLVEAQGTSRALTSGWVVIDSIAWHPSAREVWLEGVKPKLDIGLYGVRLDGSVRKIWSSETLGTIHDISRDGRVLFEREIVAMEIAFAGPSDVSERNLSWLEGSVAASLSADGQRLLFSELRQGGGAKGAAYLRKTDGSPAVRLGDGQATDLSPDGKWALAIGLSETAPRVALLPTGAGQPRSLEVASLSVLDAAFVPPDGRRVAIVASEPSHAARVYLLDPSGGKPVPVTPEGWRGRGAFSPDGKWIAGRGSDGRLAAYPLEGGEPRAVPGVEAGEEPIQWSADGSKLYLARFGDLPLVIDRIELASGRRETWKKLVPADRVGVVRIDSVHVTPDGKSYAYSYNRVLVSDLFVAENLR